MNYNLIDDSKWQKEVELFIGNRIKAEVGAFDFDVYNRIAQEINQLTSDYQNTEIHFTKSITPVEYESLVADILSEQGWDARTTAGSGDQGIDVIATKKNKKLVVQCKLYSSSVGNAAVQEVIAGKAFEKADYAAVVTNSEFTKSAKELASASNVILLHHDQLAEIETKLI